MAGSSSTIISDSYGIDRVQASGEFELPPRIKPVFWLQVSCRQRRYIQDTSALRASSLSFVTSTKRAWRTKRLSNMRTSSLSSPSGQRIKANRKSITPESNGDRVGPSRPGGGLVAFPLTQQFQTFSRKRVPHPRQWSDTVRYFVYNSQLECSSVFAEAFAKADSKNRRLQILLQCDKVTASCSSTATELQSDRSPSLWLPSPVFWWRGFEVN